MFVWYFSLSANPAAIISQEGTETANLPVSDNPDPQRIENIWNGNWTTSWNYTLNWSLGHVPLSTEDVVVGSGHTRYPIINNGYEAYCNRLTVNQNASLSVSDGILHVGENLYVDGLLYELNSAAQIWVTGNTMIDGNFIVNNMTTPYMYLYGHLNFGPNSVVSTGWGTINMYGVNKYIYSPVPVAINNLTIATSADISITSLPATFTLNGNLSVNGTFTNDSSGTIVVKANVSVGTAGNMYFTDGNLELQGGTNTTITQRNNSALWNLKVNKTAGYHATLQQNMKVYGDLTIISGALWAASFTITIRGDFINNSGSAAGFSAGTGSVIFYTPSGGIQFITGPLNFYNLTNDTFDTLTITTGSVITCASFERQTVGDLEIDGASFIVNDMVTEIDICSVYVLGGGSAEFHQDAAQGITVRGTVSVQNGCSVRIYGGLGDAHVYYTARLLPYGSGVIDFVNHGFILDVDYTNYYSDGLIRTSGNVTINDTQYSPGLGTLELYGPTSTTVYFATPDPISWLHNLIINKANGFSVAALSIVRIYGDLTILSGDYHANGFDLYLYDNATVGGELLINNATLYLDSGSIINVNNGGRFYVTGDAVNYALVTRFSVITTPYSLNVNSGGFISASYATFEYMDINGILINPGATVDPAASFKYCLLQNGVAGGNLLTINNDQDLVLYNVGFLFETTGGYNIGKSVDTGNVYVCASYGVFCGSLHEADPYNRIHWSTTIPEVTDVNLNPSVIQLDGYVLIWNYPFQVSYYNIYSSSNPYGPFEFVLSVIDRHYYIPNYEEVKFYRVTAVYNP